ncbi:MAG TPA: hypothetical protein VF352_03795 [Anaerolineales bacterium]
MAWLYLIVLTPDGSYAWSGLPLDDNWIHLVYARSLVQQGWFNYNPGVAEAGMSSPFWVILLALGYASLTPLGATPQWIAKGMSLGLAMAVPILAYFLVLRLGLKRRWAWLAGLLVIFDPNLCFGNVSGMEVPFATLLILLAILLLLRKSYGICGLVLGALVVTRAEGVPIAIMIALLPLLQEYSRRTSITLIRMGEFRIGVSLLLPPLLTGGAWALFNYSVNGQFLPNTYYVKHYFAAGLFNAENLAAILSGYQFHLPLFQGILLPFTLLFAVAAGVFLFRRKQYIPLLLLVGIPLIQLYLFSINFKVWSDGPWIYYVRRYMDFLQPFWMILVTVGLAGLWDQASRARSRIIFLTIPALTIGYFLIVAYQATGLHQRFIADYVQDTKRVETVDVAIGRWVAENLPDHSTIGITEAGALRYFARPDQTIIDFLGLNCHVCAGQPPDYIMNILQPEYLAFFRPALRDTFRYELIYSMNTYPDARGSELYVVKVESLPPWPPLQP